MNCYCASTNVFFHFIYIYILIQLGVTKCARRVCTVTRQWFFAAPIVDTMRRHSVRSPTPAACSSQQTEHASQFD